MKAVVMEIRDGYAAVLVKGGSIERIRDKGYKPGQEIEMPRKIIECGGACFSDIHSRHYLQTQLKRERLCNCRCESFA